MNTKCSCGCGELAPIRNYSAAGRGHFKGEPAIWLPGHNSKTRTTTGYRFRRVGGVLTADHRVKAERALGRPLPEGVEVHHADGTFSDQSTLVICQDRAYHQLLHVRMRIKAAGGNPNTDAICSVCKQVKTQSEFHKNRNTRLGLSVQCKQCLREYQVSRKAK